MLETIREFGLEQLEASGEADEARARHAAFFLALAEEADAALHGPKQRSWLERLETEHDNIRSALGWALTHEPETALGLVAALDWFWFYRGYLTEGRDWTERALATGASATPEVQARALNWSSWLRPGTSRLRHRVRACRRGAGPGAIGGRPVDEGWALHEPRVVAGDLGDSKRAAALSAEAEARFRSIGERHGVAMAIFNQAIEAGRRGTWTVSRSSWSSPWRSPGRSGTALRHPGPSVPSGSRTRAREPRSGTSPARGGAGNGAGVPVRLGRGGCAPRLAEVAGEQGDADQAATYLHDAEAKYRELGRRSVPCLWAQRLRLSGAPRKETTSEHAT